MQVRIHHANGHTDEIETTHTMSRSTSSGSGRGRHSTCSGRKAGETGPYGAPRSSLALAGGVAACGGDGGSERSADTTTTKVTDASTSTTGPSSTTGDTSSVTIGIICTSPSDAASSLVGAWTAGDEAAARRCADDAVVDQLFTTSGAGNTWMDQGCDTSKPASPVCAYSYEGGGALLTVGGSDAAGWKVTKLEFVAD